MRTFRVAVALVGLVCSDEAFAFTEAVKSFTPRTGDFELKLSNTLPVFVSIPTASGFTATVLSQINGGLGYCASDLVEVGASIGFTVIAPGSSPTTTSTATTTEFDLQPFLKLNLGAGGSSESRLNPYVTIAFSILVPGGGPPETLNPTTLALTLDLGLEIMVTHTWGINLFIPVDAAFDTTKPASNPVIGLGVGYGVVTYF